MTSTPKRRWFRIAFSLRTLFVVVTFFGVWLGLASIFFRSYTQTSRWEPIWSHSN
jgi:hypothetical protein